MAGKSYKQHLRECAAGGFEIRTTVSKKTVRYDPIRPTDRMCWVDVDGIRYQSHHVEAVNPKTNRRYNP